MSENDLKHSNKYRRLFFNEVVEGLSGPKKRLPSKYLYDGKGDRLFNALSRSDDYYLYRSELEIFSMKTIELMKFSFFTPNKFDVIELGAGDVSKSIHLLAALYNAGAVFDYLPIDISANTIEFLTTSLPGCFGPLAVRPLQGEFLDMLWQVYDKEPTKPKLVMCLGAAMANMQRDETVLFCRQLRAMLNPGDRIIVGFDLAKNPRLVLGACEDKDSLTAAFHFNLLTRINSELGANFDLRKFSHYTDYDPWSGACNSYLYCTQDSSVEIGKARVVFGRGEAILVEVAIKYSLDQIGELASRTGFAIEVNVFDHDRYVVDTIWTAI